eukprot:2961264-Amphidinium_carterae.1
MHAEVSAYRSATWALGSSGPKHVCVAADGFRIGTPGREFLVMAFTLPQLRVSGVLPPQVHCKRDGDNSPASDSSHSSPRRTAQ